MARIGNIQFAGLLRNVPVRRIPRLQRHKGGVIIIEKGHRIRIGEQDGVQIRRIEVEIIEREPVSSIVH